MNTISVILLLNLLINGVTSFSPTSVAAVPRSGLQHLRSSMSDADIDVVALMETDLEKARINGQYEKFGHAEWLQHRSSDRFYSSLIEYDKSPVLKNLLDEAFVLAAICTGIIVWNGLLIEGFTDFNEVQHDPILANSVPSFLHFKLSLPTEPFFLCGGPLGLLLVFRNDVCFSRYRSALHEWESAISSISNMLLEASKASESVEEVRKMGIRCWALMRTLQHEVLGDYDRKKKYEKDIRRVITNEEEADKLLGARNKLHRAKFDVHSAIHEFSQETVLLDRRALINTFNGVAASCSECEGLYSTPIPLLYTRWTLKFLTFWMTFMPFAFYDVFKTSWNHIMMIPAQTLICFLFFGIEEIAVSLEEPFSILPLDDLVDEIYECVEDTTRWMEEEKELSASGGLEKKSFFSK